MIDPDSLTTLPTKCPICESRAITPWRFSLLRCTACRFIFNISILDAVSNKRYEEQWFEDSYSIDDNQWVNLFELHRNRKIMCRIKPFLKNSPTILEIGIGSGSLLAFLKKAGYEVFGCDASKQICSAVQRKYNILVYNQNLEQLPNDLRFSCIVMNHALEHMNNPVQVLKEIANRLENNGVLHLAVPNIRSGEAFLPGWINYQPYHLGYFNKSSLLSALKKAHLGAISIKTVEPFSGWFLALLRTITGKGLNTPPPPFNAQNSRQQGIFEFFYRVVMISSGAITLPLRRLQAWSGWGEELVVIARKLKE